MKFQIRVFDNATRQESSITLHASSENDAIKQAGEMNYKVMGINAVKEKTESTIQDSTPFNGPPPLPQHDPFKPKRESLLDYFKDRLRLFISAFAVIFLLSIVIAFATSDGSSEDEYPYSHLALPGRTPVVEDPKRGRVFSREEANGHVNRMTNAGLLKLENQNSNPITVRFHDTAWRLLKHKAKQEMVVLIVEYYEWRGKRDWTVKILSQKNDTVLAYWNPKSADPIRIII